MSMNLVPFCPPVGEISSSEDFGGASLFLVPFSPYGVFSLT